MATGFSRSLEAGHDVIYDFCCTPCEGQGLNAEAQFYCKECKQLYCEACEKYHDKFFRRHTVLGIQDVSKWGNVKPWTSSLMGDEHPGNELEMYCEVHGRFCCHICVSVKQRTCRQVKPVLEVCMGIQENPKFKSFLSKAIMTQSRLKTLHDKQDNNIKMLQRARGQITSTFKNMRIKLNQILDKLEEDSTTELDRLLKMLSEHVTLDKHVCFKLLNKIQKLLDGMQTLGKQCDELAFQGYMKCAEKMFNADKLLSTMQNVDYQLNFTPDITIEQYLSSLETLGSFLVTPAGLDHRLKNNGQSKLLTSPEQIYSVVKKQTYNIKTSEDTELCWISGMCQLPDGQTTVVDLNNSRVKLLSASTYAVLDEMKLLPNPYDVCHTTGTELAVTVCEKKDNTYIRKEIQFVNARNEKLSHTRTVQLDHECDGIAYHNAQLYVGSSNALYVYDLSGKKIQKLFENAPGVYLTVYRFTCSDNGRTIYVTNFDKNLLLTLDSSGHELSTLTDPELVGPSGVCVADYGSVFVCGAESRTILQVDREGSKKMTSLVTQIDGVYIPQSLCYDRKTHTLLVGLDNLLALQLR